LRFRLRSAEPCSPLEACPLGGNWLGSLWPWFRRARRQWRSNRLADASIDAANPRTATRALPVGQLTPAFVTAFVLVSCGIFIFAASQLNRLTLMLSPVALTVILFYSYTKRFTRWSHLFLGFALGIAPAAAWIAVRGSLDPRILLLTAAVTFWVGGFDVDLRLSGS